MIHFETNVLASAPTHLKPCSKGLFPYGRFSGAVNDHHLETWEKGFAKRRLQRKSWIFGGSFSPEASVGFAIVDAGYAANAFCYYFDRRKSKPNFIEEKSFVPFYFPKDFKPSIKDVWHFKSGKNEWKIEPTDDGIWNFTYKGSRLNLHFQLEHSFEGISAVAPVHKRPFNATYKLASIPSHVHVECDQTEHSWSSRTGSFDFTLGFPPLKTYWNWGSFAGETENGTSLGINLVRIFNDGLENALWIAGKLVPLSHAHFEIKGTGKEKHWSIHTVGGELNLDFYPEAEYGKNLDLFLLKSKFKQAIGFFSGVLKNGDQSIRIRGNGVVEEHDAVW